MAKTSTRRWDATEYLQTPEDMAAYLKAAQEDGDPPLIRLVQDDIDRAQRRVDKTIPTNQFGDTAE